MSDTLQLVVSLHTLNVELNERHDKLKRIGHEKAAGDLSITCGPRSEVTPRQKSAN